MIKKNNFYFFLILFTFSKIISNENFSVSNQYKENINIFNSLLKDGIDMTEEEKRKKFHEGLQLIEINTNAFFEADRADKLNDSELNRFKEYTIELLIVRRGMFKKYVSDKFYKVDKPLDVIYHDLFSEKYFEVCDKIINVMKKKTFAKMILNYYQDELPLNSLSKSENKALRENKDQKICSEIQYFFVNLFGQKEVVNEITLLDKKRGERIKNLLESSGLNSIFSIFNKY